VSQFNPAALNTDDMVNEAVKLQNEAAVIYNDPKASADDLAKADRMIDEAIIKTTRSKKLRDIGSDMQVLLNNPTKDAKNNPDFELSWEGWGEYLNAVKAYKSREFTDPRLKYESPHSRMPVAAKDLSGNVGSAGGFLAPVQFIPQIRALQAEASIVAPRATVIPMATRSIQMPALQQGQTTAGVSHYFGGIQVFYQGEAATMTSTDAAFRLLTLEAYDLTGLIHVPDTLLADSAISVSAWLQGPLGLPGAFAHRADYAYLRGTGAGQPLGVLNSGALISRTRTTGSTIKYDDIVNVLSRSLPTPNRCWVASISSLATLLTINGPSGNPSYLWGSMENGVPSRLMGLPILWTEKMPAMGSAGDLLLADFSFYLIGERENYLFDTTDQVKWTQNMTSFKAVMRHDGQPWLALPFTLMDGTTTISPFVTIAA
jgi:HK97 family phage major capsid protein